MRAENENKYLVVSLFRGGKRERKGRARWDEMKVFLMKSRGACALELDGITTFLSFKKASRSCLGGISSSLSVYHVVKPLEFENFKNSHVRHLATFLVIDPLAPDISLTKSRQWNSRVNLSPDVAG